MKTPAIFTWEALYEGLLDAIAQGDIETIRDCVFLFVKKYNYKPLIKKGKITEKKLFEIASYETKKEPSISDLSLILTYADSFIEKEEAA